MTATTRRDMLVSQLVRQDDRWANDGSPTYLMNIRLGHNWGTYMIVAYEPSDFAAERTDQTPRPVELSGDTPVTITIGNTTYEVLTIS